MLPFPRPCCHPASRGPRTTPRYGGCRDHPGSPLPEKANDSLVKRQRFSQRLLLPTWHQGCSCHPSTDTCGTASGQGAPRYKPGLPGGVSSRLPTPIPWSLIWGAETGAVPGGAPAHSWVWPVWVRGCSPGRELPCSCTASLRGEFLKAPGCWEQEDVSPHLQWGHKMLPRAPSAGASTPSSSDAVAP